MAIDAMTGAEDVVHECTNEECGAHMHRDGNILRCNLCGNSVHIANHPMSQQPVPIDLTEAPGRQLATA